VEIILSVDTIVLQAIDRFIVAKEELLPGVEARGVVVKVRVDETEDNMLLDRLHDM